MKKCFNVLLGKDDFAEFNNCGQSKKTVNEKKLLRDLVQSSVILSAEDIKKTLLPTETFDVFISHAHKDWDLAIRFKNYLEQTFSLRVFVDSLYWGNIDDLQKEWNKGHLKDGVYDYKLTNRVAQHANIILATALSDMINKCELVFFLHTENSVAEHPDLLDKDATFSPWIYYELHTASLLERNKRILLDEAFYSATESLKPVSYTLPLSEMIKLERKDFDGWEAWYDFYRMDALKSLDQHIKNRSN